jgi:branched-chain amino acid transport system permease protein
VTELLQFTLFGLMAGCIYAIASMGLVLTYNVSGVFNFAHGAVGMAAAFTYYELRVENGWPALVAIVVVVGGLCPLLGVVVDRLLRNFRGADFATSLVVTIALTIAFLGVVDRIYDPGQARFTPLLFGDREIVIADVPISWDQLFQVVVAVAVAFGLRFLLFSTLLGSRMRAVVDDGELADLHGVQSRQVSRIGPRPAIPVRRQPPPPKERRTARRGVFAFVRLARVRIG